MAERIIPIRLEGEDEQKENGSGDEQKIAKPMEQLTIKPDKPNIQIKPASEAIEQENKLQEFDLFEEGCKVNLPNANVKEKIILVVDRAQDENPTPFRAKNQTFTPLSMLKRALHIFLELKHNIDSKHEFAIMTLNENNSSWITEFTSDIKKLHNIIDQIAECEVEDTFNLGDVFEQIMEKVSICAPKEPEEIPDFVIRTIVCWGRSYTLPQIDKTESLSVLFENPYFVCDILITHEPIGPGNYCDKIFNLLQNIGSKGSYFFPVGRDTARLHSSMARLMGHPLQRAEQKRIKV
nr:unnamed protein product [Callosobruchus chinensis]